MPNSRKDVIFKNRFLFHAVAGTGNETVRNPGVHRMELCKPTVEN